MSQILIRNLDEGTVMELKKLAKQHGRSLEAEARYILTQSTKLKAVNPAQIAESIRKKIGTKKHSDSTQLISEDRKR